MAMEPGCNRLAAILEVEHFLLDGCGHPNQWRSHCPVCGEGTLAVARHPESQQLQEYDNCLLCAQRVRYLDIKRMRTIDGRH
jgi:hypothetical protein